MIKVPETHTLKPSDLKVEALQIVPSNGRRTIDQRDVEKTIREVFIANDTASKSHKSDAGIIGYLTMNGADNGQFFQIRSYGSNSVGTDPSEKKFRLNAAASAIEYLHTNNAEYNRFFLVKVTLKDKDVDRKVSDEKWKEVMAWMAVFEQWIIKYKNVVNAGYPETARYVSKLSYIMYADHRTQYKANNDPVSEPVEEFESPHVVVIAQHGNGTEGDLSSPDVLVDLLKWFFELACDGKFNTAVNTADSKSDMNSKEGDSNA